MLMKKSEISMKEEPHKISILNAYREHKITKKAFQKWINDGYNVKTTMIETI